MSTHPRSSPLADEPPKKRQKTLMELERSSDFWFKTGNFVLIASGVVAYRVHGDVLGRRSKVFNDLLNDDVPHPGSEESMEGCPIVHVSDPPDDFQIFLGFVYDGFERHQEHIQRPRWKTVRAMILLGDKYDMSQLREEGLTQLRSHYADDVNKWDSRDDAFYTQKTDCLSAASVTHTLGDPSLHAAVLYECCSLSPSQLVHTDPVAANSVSPLSAADHVRILYYLSEINGVRIEFLQDLFEHYSDYTECSNPGCQVDERELEKMIRDTYQEYLTDFLDGYRSEALLSEFSWLNSCDGCRSYFTGRLHNLRQKYWSKRADYFEPSI